MRLQHFYTETSEDDSRIIRVSGRIGDIPETSQQAQWIDFQVVIDLPIALNGALQRAKALRIASEMLPGQAAHFERLGRPSE